METKADGNHREQAQGEFQKCAISTGYKSSSQLGKKSSLRGILEMTYFNPEIYNKHNLKKRDRDEIEFYAELIKNVLLNTEDVIKMHTDKDNPISKGIADYQLAAIDEVREQMAMQLHDVVVGYIENYNDEDFESLRIDGDHERKVQGVEYKTSYDAMSELLDIEVDEEDE